MVDYQFLGMVAVTLAVMTRGSLPTVAVVTGFVAAVTVAYEAGARWYRRRHPGPVPRPAAGATTPSDGELSRWMAAVERVLGSPD
jgi:hypothetical protein